MEKRTTIQKKLVLDAVLRLADHPTAEQVYAEVVKEHPTVSKATVYRNLNGLVEAGRVRRVSVPGQADRFDAPWPITTICSAPGAAGWRTFSWTKRRWTR